MTRIVTLFLTTLAGGFCVDIELYGTAAAFFILAAMVATVIGVRLIEGDDGGRR